jgi:Yip1 domain
MNVAARVHRILADPVAEWAKIADEFSDETADVEYLFASYVARLALIPALFGFVGACVVGVAEPGRGAVRAPIFDGLFGAVLGYLLSCAAVMVLGLLVAALAPTFGGRRNFTGAFKLAAYSYTPVWLAGIFLLAPGLRFLSVLGFYGVYLLWTGLPPMMKVPLSSVPCYTAAIAVSACVLTVAVAIVQHGLFGLHF